MTDRFHIGQRVRRKVGSGRVPAGAIGEIVRGREWTLAEDTGWDDWYIVRFDGIQSGFSNAAYPNWTDCFSCIESELEPIYDGNEKTSWEGCAWRPQGSFSPRLVDVQESQR